MRSSTCPQHSLSSQIESMDFKLTSSSKLETQIILLIYILITVYKLMYLIKNKGNEHLCKSLYKY